MSEIERIMIQSALYVNAVSCAYTKIVRKILHSSKFAALSGNLYNTVSCMSNVNWHWHSCLWYERVSWD